MFIFGVYLQRFIGVFWILYQIWPMSIQLIKLKNVY